jgi:glycosyltransferase involved in cell wall biosynthesis
MKIFFDEQSFIMQNFGGISRYYTEIIYYLKKNNLAEIYLPLVYTSNVHLNEKKILDKNLKIIESFCIKNNILRNKIIRRLKRKNDKLINQKVNTNNFDLFIPTYYFPTKLNLLDSKPFVLTIYDMIHELFPNCFPAEDLTIKFKKDLIYKSKKIIAVSKNTKKDILKFYPDVDPEKIHVIYHGYSENLGNILPKNLPKKYILFVGNRKEYKNFTFFIKSIRDFILENDISVLCAGGLAFDETELNMFNELGIKDKVTYYKFLDAELPAIYKNANCFVFPSLYEGFGIPVLEAMANGCPIVLSDSSSFPEVAGDAGIFFEIGNSNDLVDKISKACFDDGYRSEMIKRGFQNVSRFSWEEAANECFEVYKLAINS